MDKEVEDWGIEKQAKLYSWEHREKVRETMINDVIKSIKLHRQKGKEPFSFSELVESAKKTIWLPHAEVVSICKEALFRNLDSRDYRYMNKELFEESMKDVYHEDPWTNQNTGNEWVKERLKELNSQ